MDPRSFRGNANTIEETRLLLLGDATLKQRVTTSAKTTVLPAAVKTAAVDVRAEEFQQLFEQHSQAVGRRIGALVGDPGRAGDLVQETFLIAWRRWKEFRGDASRKGWVMGIALNVARNARRKRGRREPANARRRNTAAGASPEQAMEGREAAARLSAAFAELPPEQQDAFGLRVLEGLGLAEAAKVLRLPESTVSYRARQAEKKLRAALDDEQGEKR